MADEQGFRVPEVTKLVGVTYRQLDYWTRTGLVQASIREAGGSGTQRLYSFTDVLELKAIKKMEDIGLSLQKIRKAVKSLSEILEKRPHSASLASDGVTMYAVEDDGQLVDLARKGQLAFFIPLGELRTELEEAVGTAAGGA
ncbi:MAG: MerR family transcriptional regulator [Actinobacteria bacterium]|nr:MerR family transcriptional regulator [Actinomycetota bacterium]